MNGNFYASSIYTGEVAGTQAYGYLDDDPYGNIGDNDAAGGRFTGFSGGSVDFIEGGVARTALFDVPREPLLSLGSLQHANIGRYTIDPSYIIGNSFAPARIRDLNDFHATGYGDKNIDAWDLSYVLNQQLWDSYFFSSIPQGLTPANLSDLQRDKGHLPNHRLRLISRDARLSPDDLTNNDGGDDSETFYEVASNMAIEGAFNINSTSAEAWAAFLASSRNLAIPSYHPDTAELQNNTTTESGAVFSRLMHPIDGKYDSIDVDGMTFWRGYRALDDAETQALATEIVALIRQRGEPFSSLAEFVNRPLEDAPNNGPARAGILQEAVNRAGLNDAVLADAYSGAPSPSGITHNQFNGNAPTSGFPGYLTQADILQTLGPLMTARSDTFTIRSYGDSINPLTGNVDTQAWCEAVVQRMPEETVHGQDHLARDANRRFRIISFRWLTKSDI